MYKTRCDRGSNAFKYSLRVAALGAIAILLAASVNLVAAETWRGLVLAPEQRCSPYNRKRDYQYSQSVEREIVNRLGAVYGPYTGSCFESIYETDIEHIVATSEAHDSGLCAQDRASRKRFAQDLRNLTLASPSVNRYEKSDRDAAEWMPDRNRCWFAARIVEVRRAYGLTIDRREAVALEQVLTECESISMEPLVCVIDNSNSQRPSSESFSGSENALDQYDDNKNGRITCKEARRHGIAPVHKSHPAYRFMRDNDGDGYVCE